MEDTLSALNKKTLPNIFKKISLNELFLNYNSERFEPR